MKIKFIENERALIVENFLVIADLHMGYEKTLEDKGYNIPTLRKDFVKRIKNLQKTTSSSKLIILGDIKHNVPISTKDERYELPKFFREISKFFDEIIVIKGNHDGNIEKMVHEEKVKILPEYIHKNFTFIHGHRYPSEKAMQSKIIFMGHTHPTYKIKDGSGIKHNYACWTIGKINSKKLDKYKKISCEKVIIVPSFNQLTTGYKGLSGPLAKAIKREEIYLIDLTKVM